MKTTLAFTAFVPWIVAAVHWAVSGSFTDALEAASLLALAAFPFWTMLASELGYSLGSMDGFAQAADMSDWARLDTTESDDVEQKQGSADRG